MTTYNTVIKKRNPANDGWDTILPITTADNVLINEEGDTIATHLAETTTHISFVTRDISLTGNQEISLIAGRTPKSVNVYAFVNDTVGASWGFVNSTTATSMARQANNTMVNPSTPIYLEASAGNVASGNISLASGKLTIAWSKTGSPTGTAQIRLIANYHD